MNGISVSTGDFGAIAQTRQDSGCYPRNKAMPLRKGLQCAFFGMACLSAVFAFQRPFRELPGIEYQMGEIPLPADYQEKTEWAFARLMFPPGPLNGYRGPRFGLAHRHFALDARIFRAPTGIFRWPCAA